MKVIQFFAITAMAAAMFTSCSNDEELVQSNFPSDNIIRVTAGVNNAKTRGNEANGSLLDKDFLLTIVNKTADKYTYINKQFSKTAGEWKCSETLLWQNATTPVDIAAFAPAQTTVFDNVYKNDAFQSFAYSVAADQTDGSANNDLLYYYKKDFNPGDELVDKKLNLQFNHAFSMIDIVVTLGTQFNVPNIPSETPITEVTVEGTKLEADVNVTNETGIVTVKESAKATVITATKGAFTSVNNDVKKSCTSKFSCIAIPQTIAAKTFKIILKANDKYYEWTLADAITLKSGYKYTINLTMGNDVALTNSNSFTATPWTEGADSGSSIETE